MKTFWQKRRCQATNRQGEYYYLMRAFDNGGASWQTDNLVSSLGGSITLSSFLPANPESYTYDLDGNLLTDGRWQYTWDAENRLTSMETSGAAFGVGVPSQRLEFQYDYLGRRVLKRTLSWSNLVSERRFLYDGWNLLEEFDTTSGFSLVAQHVWGIDLGGGLQDAGGVGGLLLTTTVDGGSRVNLIPAFDGNGNVHPMIDAASGSLRAKFEYNAFGETLPAPGDLASKVPFRFSTKYTDQESQFLYYGFRYYNPNLGRFLGRDPMEEAGGLHLYAFCGNNGVNRWDVLGMYAGPNGTEVTEFSGLADPSWKPIGLNINLWVAPDNKNYYQWIDPDLALLDSNDPYWDAHANDSHSNNYEEYAASLNAQQDKMSAQNEAFFEDFDRRALQDPAPGPVAKTAVSPPSVVAPNAALTFNSTLAATNTSLLGGAAANGDPLKFDAPNYAGTVTLGALQEFHDPNNPNFGVAPTSSVSGLIPLTVADYIGADQTTSYWREKNASPFSAIQQSFAEKSGVLKAWANIGDGVGIGVTTLAVAPFVVPELISYGVIGVSAIESAANVATFRVGIQLAAIAGPSMQAGKLVTSGLPNTASASAARYALAAVRATETLSLAARQAIMAAGTPPPVP